MTQLVQYLLLISAQVMIAGSCDRAMCQAPCSAWSLLKILSPSLLLPLSPTHSHTHTHTLSLKEKKNEKKKRKKEKKKEEEEKKRKKK